MTLQGRKGPGGRLGPRRKPDQRSGGFAGGLDVLGRRLDECPRRLDGESRPRERGRGPMLPHATTREGWTTSRIPPKAWLPRTSRRWAPRTLRALRLVPG